MRRNTVQLWIGGALALMGALVLLQEMGIIPDVSWFWAVVFIFSGAAFMVLFARHRAWWWALIPGLALLGVGVTMLLPEPLSYLGGAVTLGAVGVSFFLVYLTAHEHWWAIIPAGVLLTLAAVSALTPSLPSLALGALFFLGLALTFFLVAVLPNPLGRMTWALIPGGVLFLMGLVSFTIPFQKYAIYIWSLALIATGAYLLILYFRRT